MKRCVDRALDVLLKQPCAYALMALGFILDFLIELPFLIAMRVDDSGRQTGRRRRP
jgi:hypothetical protein